MKMANKWLLLLGVLVVDQINFYGQETWPYGRLKELKRERLLFVYLDTLTQDTLFVNNEIGQRIIKSKENVEISRGSVFGGMGSACGCEPRPHGLWIKRHRNGNYKEIGEYYCNRKKGTWIYYHENGNLKRYETYESPYLEWLTEQGQPWDTLKRNSYLLSGLYAEYYANGKLKEEGRYEIIEEFSETDTLTTFDPYIYEEVTTILKGAFWIPKSVKSGVWVWSDENGNLVRVEIFEHPWHKNSKYRPIASRYYELFEEDKK